MKRYYFSLYGGSNKKQWVFLQHNGPMFPPPYVPHKIPVIVNNVKHILPPIAEEYITLYAKYHDSHHLMNNIFKKNFWKDLKPELPSELQNTDLDSFDLSLIIKHINLMKERKANLTKDMKELILKKKEELEEPYKFCIIDGAKQNVGNYKIEPVSIFIGRGTHPKIGCIKKRIFPEDVTINLSKDAKIPDPNIHYKDAQPKDIHHKWGKVIHDPTVIWLASWKEEITGKMKYIFTSLDSIFKSISDEKKFDLAKKLKKKIKKIRHDYKEQLEDINIKNKQLATALYFIDNLALRVGGSKDTKETSDTVGVTSLRVEHVTLYDNNTIKLDFLGKDSIRYCKKFKVIESVYKNLEQFIKNKTKKEKLFDFISASSINEYLNNFMKDLTAKVLRTYTASLLFQKEINKISEDHVKKLDSNERLNYLIAMFNQANTSVALLCNHQKNVNSESQNKTIDKINDMIKKLRKKAKKGNSLKYTNKIKLLKLKKETKIKMKNVSLTTSKNNYIDPRIIFAFIKKFEIEPEKIFNKVLIKRFEWASKVDKDYQF
jgi:DNA topoisomerase-1